MKFWQVDAFTDEAYRGNPAAIFVVDEFPPTEWLHRVAREMNLSETAFVRRDGDAWHLRWFTPVNEVDLCGHATLAAAHVLWEQSLLDQAEPAVFTTRSGKLIARNLDGAIELDFPALPAAAQTPPEKLIRALGVEPVWAGRSRFDWLLEVADANTLRTMTPNFSLLYEVETRGILVTAASDDPEFDLLTRTFFPREDVNEDPVCGSAHCTLATYWGEKLNRPELKSYQASPRGGIVQMRWQDDRVALIGPAVTVLQGQLMPIAYPVLEQTVEAADQPSSTAS